MTFVKEKMTFVKKKTVFVKNYPLIKLLKQFIMLINLGIFTIPTIKRRKPQMIRRSVLLLFILMSILFPVTSVFSQATDDIFNIIFSNDFEDNTVGLYDYDEWSGEWNMAWDAWWANSDITYIEENDNDKVMKWIFPEGSVNGIDQGGKFHPDIPGIGAGYNELYLSYNIMFKPGFDFVISGKIPSMGGGEDWNDHGGAPLFDEGFRCGLAWFKTWDGKGGLRFYIYHHDQPGPYGHTRNWSDPDSEDVYKFPTDGENWVNVTIRIVLNTVNTPPENGMLIMWMFPVGIPPVL
ncbi:hypothetical protein ES705_03560 [subsurface metagenome]